MNRFNLDNKQKKIVMAAAVVLGFGAVYGLTSKKEQPVQVSTGKGASLSDSGASLSKSGQNTLDDFLNQAGQAQKPAEGGKFISLDNSAITTEQAEKMLMTAVKSGDVERVKFLLSSGVRIDFTDDTVCTDDPYGLLGNGPNGEIERNYISDPQQAKDFIHVNPILIYTTSCNKLFLKTALLQLDRKYSEEENGYFLAKSIAAKEIAKPYVNEYRKRLEIFELLLAATPKKDYYQFIGFVSNTSLPLNIRRKIVGLYLECLSNAPMSEGRAKFLKAYEDLIMNGIKAHPNDRGYLSIAINYKNPLHAELIKIFDSMIENLYQGLSQIESWEEWKNGPNNIPKLSVKSLENGRINYDINSNIKLNAFYEANRELEIANLLINSGKVNLNLQDENGQTLLHHIANKLGTTKSHDRATAVVVRYLLNIGANPSIIDKNGNTPHGITQESTDSCLKRGCIDPNTKYMPGKELQDAFTLKSYD